MYKRTSAEWLQRAREGDTEAFSELVEPFRQLAYSVAVRLVGYSYAEDVVMDAYLKAWQALPSFRGRVLKSWLLRIVRNVAMDRIRYEARRPTVSLDAPHGRANEGDSVAAASQDVPDDGIESPAEILGRREDVVQVRTALKGLSDLYRTSLLLRYADGLSYREIAAATGVSIGTVMSRLHNGKRRLTALLTSQHGITS